MSASCGRWTKPEAGQRQELLEQLGETDFLIGENAASGKQRLMRPPRLYQRTKDLEVYFDGNPDAWFAADGYGPWLVQLRGMGVRPGVDVRARTPNQHGQVMITVEFGRNERGLDGFDPDAQIDGLDFALSHPSHARSEYVWNVLLAPNRRLVAGVVETSVLQSFGDSSQETVMSAIGVAAEREAWLPGRDETFRRPGELSLDDLPPTYTRDDGLAHALHMLQPVVADAARQLGIPPGDPLGPERPPRPNHPNRTRTSHPRRARTSQRSRWPTGYLGRYPVGHRVPVAYPDATGYRLRTRTCALVRFWGGGWGTAELSASWRAVRRE